MPSSLASILRRRGFDLEDVPGADVERALGDADLRPELKLRCLNPRCDQLCDWSDAKGRMPKFCSGKCRQQFTNNYQRLEREIAILTQAIDRADTGPRLRRRLTRERAQRLFEFCRYVQPESTDDVT